MHYTKRDAKYIITTFVVLFIATILNFNLSLPVGEVVVSIGVGVLFGAIFTMIRLKKYLESKKFIALYILLTISGLSFLIPLCLYGVISDITPQLEFVSNLLLLPKFTPVEFNQMVTSLKDLQGSLVLVTAVQSIASGLPLCGTLICIGSILDDVGESCDLKSMKKVKKNYVIAAITLVLLMMFSIIVMNFAYNTISFLSMDAEGNILISDEKAATQAVSSIMGVGFLVVAIGITYLVFFIRGLVIMNRASKEIDRYNPHDHYTSNPIDNEENNDEE